MTKTTLYRLFGAGSIPSDLRPALESEGVIVLDEGIGGRLITKHVDGPGVHYRHRREGFSGSLAITRKRLVCHTYGKRQINISLHDPKIASLYIDAPTDQSLELSFESSDFRQGWQGVMEFHFRTDKAHAFLEALTAVGVRRGSATERQPAGPEA